MADHYVFSMLVKTNILAGGANRLAFVDYWINDGGPSQMPLALTRTAHPASAPENNFPTCC